MNELKIYRSSAGSGKTYMLVFEYLRIVLERPAEFRHILAVTFTNKAADEMKSRIISALSELSAGGNENLEKHLKEFVNPKINIRLRAKECLDLILHNYSDFSVTTIDSFFYRIVRSVAREINLPAGVDVEMDSEAVIDSVTDELFAEVGSDEKLSRWLTMLLLNKLNDDGHWKIEREIKTIGRELLKEDTDKLHSLTHESISDLSGILMAIKKRVESEIYETACNAISAFNTSGLTAKDFYYGSKGVIGYFERLSHGAKGQNILPNSYVKKTYDEGIWCSDKSALKENINQLAERSLFPCLENIMSVIKNDGEKYFSALEVLKYIYVLGIAGDLNRKLGEYRGENNVVLISDNAKLISHFISSDDAPFIFDKIGTRYRHFLIDEFQDTSTIQWKNLLPLIRNSLAEGNFSLIVGDVKQSIYRWRGGNIQLLSGKIKNDLMEFSPLIKDDNLIVNRRSKQNIVDFNNQFFTTILAKLNDFYEGAFTEVFSEDDIIQQTDAKNIQGGYVQVNFLADENSGNGDSGLPLKFKEQAMQNTLEEIRELLADGYEYKDIAILFRKNDEGNAMAEFLCRNGITKVLSPDSLLLTGSPDVRFLISLFRYLLNPYDAVSRTHVLHHYHLFSDKNTKSAHEIFSDSKLMKKSSGRSNAKQKPATLFDTKPLENNLFNKLVPEEFVTQIPRMLNLPVYELCENLIRIFGLNKMPDAYIQRFQDCILEKSRKRNSSVKSFLEWWDENKEKDGNSVLLPESENAISIMTVHKAKGLQFPVVFIPFFDWTIMSPKESLLWTTSDTAPFSEAGKIPVRFGKALGETVFKEHYSEEIKNYMADAFNMIYVAFTRAMERLYVFSPAAKLPVKEFKTSKDILASSISEIIRAEKLMEFILGEKTKPGNKGKKKDAASVTMDEYISTEWRNKISVAEKNFRHSSLVKEQIRKVHFGSIAHNVLASLESIDDLDPELNKIFYAGWIDEESKLNLKNQIEKIFKNESIKGFFSSQWTAMTEREILLPDGKILRPDRVLLKDDHAIVIDFKTGKVKPEHALQVQTYAEQLAKMNYTKIEKYLVYLENACVVAV